MLLHPRGDPGGRLGPPWRAHRRASIRGPAAASARHARGSGSPRASDTRSDCAPRAFGVNFVDELLGTQAGHRRRFRRAPQRRRPRLPARSRRRRRRPGDRTGRPRRGPDRFDPPPDPARTVAGACRCRATPTSRWCSPQTDPGWPSDTVRRRSPTARNRPPRRSRCSPTHWASHVGGTAVDGAAELLAEFDPARIPRDPVVLG